MYEFSPTTWTHEILPNGLGLIIVVIGSGLICWLSRSRRPSQVYDASLFLSVVVVQSFLLTQNYGTEGVSEYPSFWFTIIVWSVVIFATLNSWSQISNLDQPPEIRKSLTYFILFIVFFGALPTLQQFLNGADRTQCKPALRNMKLALDSYFETYPSLSTGGATVSETEFALYQE